MQLLKNVLNSLPNLNAPDLLIDNRISIGKRKY